MIYFIDDEKLARELRDNVTPEFEKFGYFVLISLWSVISSSSSYIALTFHAPTAVERLLDFYILVVTMTGIWTCYDRNKEGDHRDFITRMTCLGFPAMIRAYVLGCIIFIPAKIAQAKFDVAITDDFLVALTNLLMWPYLYWRLYKTVGIASGADQDKDKAKSAAV